MDEAFLRGKDRGQLFLDGSAANLRTELKGQSELHFVGGHTAGSLVGDPETKVYFHARSAQPLEQGRFQAALLDGQRSELVMQGRFFRGQTVVVDQYGKQTVIDPDLRFNPANGHFYKLVELRDGTSATWAEAKALAEALSFHGPGHLATIASADEALFIEKLPTILSSQNSLWLDGTDTAEEGVWRFTSGPEAGTVFYQGGCEKGSGGCSEQVPVFADWFRGGHDDQPSGGDQENPLDNGTTIRARPGAVASSSNSSHCLATPAATGPLGSRTSPC